MDTRKAPPEYSFAWGCVGFVVLFGAIVVLLVLSMSS
jgi:hypothetical protein